MSPFFFCLNSLQTPETLILFFLLDVSKNDSFCTRHCPVSAMVFTPEFTFWRGSIMWTQNLQFRDGVEVREAEEQCWARRETACSALGWIPTHGGYLKRYLPSFISQLCLISINYILFPENASFSACLNVFQCSLNGPAHLHEALSKNYSLPLTPLGAHSVAPFFLLLTSGCCLALSNIL